MLARLLGAALLALAFIMLPAIAFAADTSVAIPIGDWTAEIVAAAPAIIVALIAWALRKLPANISGVLQTMRADQLLEKAVAYGLNAVAGAEKGKTLDVNLGNQVLATAASYAIQHGAPAVIDWLGGSAAISEKIIARLNLGADAQVVGGSTGATIVPAPVTAPAAGGVYLAAPAGAA